MRNIKEKIDHLLILISLPFIVIAFIIGYIARLSFSGYTKGYNLYDEVSEYYKETVDYTESK